MMKLHALRPASGSRKKLAKGLSDLRGSYLSKSEINEILGSNIREVKQYVDYKI